MKQIPIITNHPVHVQDEEGNKSPSAFIPFCAFGKNISRISKFKDEFTVPACNSFKTKFMKDQVCYEVDLNNITREESKLQDLKEGLMLILDYNEDRFYEDKNAHLQQENRGV